MQSNAGVPRKVRPRPLIAGQKLTQPEGVNMSNIDKKQLVELSEKLCAYDDDGFTLYNIKELIDYLYLLGFLNEDKLNISTFEPERK